MLGDVERQRLRRQLEVAAACGTRFGAFRRFVPEGSAIVEERLVCQHKCGTRACAECDAAIRQRECGRVAGNWRMFLTVGIPSEGLSVRQAWYRIRRARDLLIKRIRRHAEREDAWAVRVWAADASAATAARAAAGTKPAKRSALEYAWCLEPHVSGYPHLHLVVNACYVDYSWLRKVWSECIGRKVRWVRGEVVKNADGICRYLSKYISKTSFPADLCAVMYRQRLWGTSLPLTKGEEQGWVREQGTDEAAASGDAHHPEEWQAERGFAPVLAKPGRFALWRRVWQVDSDAAAEALWEHARQHVVTSERAPPIEPEADDSRSSLWPLWDLILEVAYTNLSGR